MDYIRTLIRLGINLNQRIIGQNTNVLNYAARYAAPPHVIQILIRAGANANNVTSGGKNLIAYNMSFNKQSSPKKLD